MIQVSNSAAQLIPPGTFPGSLRMKVYFADREVSDQLFYLTRHSFAIVNIRPLLPGHVLVCPRRKVERLHQLTQEEHADLFAAVRVISHTVSRYNGADALNIAVQDGVLAGQTVGHVHVHIVPRVLNDLPNVYDIYKLLNSNNIEEAHKEMRDHSALGEEGLGNNRTVEEMKADAEALRFYMATNADPNI